MSPAEVIALKFLPLIWSGIWRKPGRTRLILLQVSVGFALFGVLQGMKSGVDRAIADARADVLIVGRDTYGGEALPLGYYELIKSVGGVSQATLVSFFPGTYQRPTQPVGVAAINFDQAWTFAFPDFVTVTPHDLEALGRIRTGALITPELQKRYHWKIGDRIPLTTTTRRANGSPNWTFDVVGTYVAHEADGGNDILANYAYVDEARAIGKGTVDNFCVLVSHPQQAIAVADKIDHTFSNSAHPTQTVSARDRAQSQMESIGDLNFLIRSVVTGVLVALVFSVATMAIQSLQERRYDLAVLKTLGFTDGAIFLLILTEMLLIWIAGAVLGLLAALLVFPIAGQFMPGLSMPASVIEAGLAGAVILAVVSASVPAWTASRVRIVEVISNS